ncbi:MAG: hypothetical protein IKJ24_00650 [Clostridia bacterium]|nr:hypothetical protein [Clostridia bacterium]
MQHRYFAAANSAEGFKNYYPEVFSRADFVYIIKGGPGTGKSSLMRRFAARAEKQGALCEYYFCSSDPSSLDGVLAFGEKGAIGILDGTSPHVSEPKFPGAREQIINLGECWDVSLLRKQKNEIMALSERKGAEYKSAYSYLRSVGNLRAVSEGFLSEAIEYDKLRGAVGRLIRELSPGRASITPAILDSVSMGGRVRLPTFEDNAQKLYIISDFHGLGEIFLTELLEQLSRRDVSLRVSFDPVSSQRVDGIFLEGERVAFVSLADAQERYESERLRSDSREVVLINSKRFVDPERLRDIRSELRYTDRLAASSLDGALHALSKAKIYHFLLEDIYGKAMDWSKFETICAELCEKI